MPERDSCLVFDGSLLHTVLPPAAARQVAAAGEARLTLMFGFWAQAVRAAA
jgi:hypothetical protein